MAKEKSRTRKKGIFYYMSYRNLLGDIRQLGYTYTFGKLALTFIIMIAGCILAGYLYRFRGPEYFVVTGAGILLLPLFIRNGYLIMYQQHRFSDVSKYMEKFLYYYNSSRKIYTALNDVAKAFNEGEMHDAIAEALDFMQYSVENTDMEKRALELIEKRFPCNRLKVMHQYMLNAERYGGDSSMGVSILLEERKLWLERTLEMQNEMQVTKLNAAISPIATVIMCLIMIYMPEMSGISNADISDYWYVRWSAALMMIIFMIVYLVLNRKMCVNWLEDRTLGSEKWDVLYNKVVNFNKKQSRMKWRLAGIVPLVLTGVLYLEFEKNYILIGGILTVLLTINMGDIIHKIYYGDVLKKLKNDFPSWFLQVSLYMQNDNVQVSLRKSLDTAPDVLKPEIERLVQELEFMPESPEPYNNFAGYFNISEINEAMSSLYGISMGAGGDINLQFKEIIRRNNVLLDKTEKNKNKDTLTMLDAFVYIPTAVGAFKLMIDMVALMMAFLTNSSAYLK